MQVPPMRPTFEIDFPIVAEESIRRLSTLLNDADFPITCRIAGTHLMLVIPPAHRHFWSPWLNIEVHAQESGTTIHGRFSPNPSVWTGFMLGYITMGTLSFFGLMFGVAQWMMKKPPTALEFIPIFLVVAALMYWSSLVGQRIAQAQMHELYDASMGVLTNTPEGVDSSKENRTTDQAVS